MIELKTYQEVELGLLFWVKDSLQLVSVLSALVQTMPEQIRYSNGFLNPGPTHFLTKHAVLESHLNQSGSCQGSIRRNNAHPMTSLNSEDLKDPQMCKHGLMR